MATNPILGRDIYLALAAVGWADGQLTPAAADAIVRTALEEGLEIEEIAQIEEACKNRIDVGIVDRYKMSKSDRLYVYAIASWITQLDGNVTDAEQRALKKLARALGVPNAPRVHADAIMRKIAEKADRPERFDLLALRLTLDERLQEAAAARAESARKSDPQVDSEEELSETAGERPRVDVRPVVVLKPGPAWRPDVDARHQEGFDAHVEHWRRWLDEGKLDMGGPWLDGGGAIYIPAVGVLDSEIAKHAVADPAVKSSVMTFEIRRWYVAVHKP